MFLEPYAAWSDVDARAMVRKGLLMYDLDQQGAYSWLVAVGPEGTSLGTLGTYRHAGVATEVMSSRDPGVASPAQDLLHWEAMRRHRDAGDEVFDLAGMSPDPATGKEEGIRRFKEKWGGAVVPAPQYELWLQSRG
jgi:hypothetical protein